MGECLGGYGVMGVYAGSTLSFNQREIEKDANFFASGGTVTEITQNGVVYRVHSFTTTGSSTLTVNRLLRNCEYLVVAGGGGGGRVRGGGGGAGGALTGSASMNPQGYTILIGNGGEGSIGSTGANNGANSAALGFTAIGGGNGARPTNASVGGSGGGGGGGLVIISGMLGQAVKEIKVAMEETLVPVVVEALGLLDQIFFSGSVGGAGGIGIASSITGSTVYYGGGGGGMSNDSSTPVLGGLGGGGQGASTLSGTNNCTSGTSNTGGGGGGANNAGGSVGGQGGSGIVIIRYPIGVVGQ
jgi:hypothetical protein